MVGTANDNQTAQAIDCSSKHPEHLRSHYIRTSFATSIGKLNTRYSAEKMLCLMMDHIMQVHEPPLGTKIEMMFPARKVADIQTMSPTEWFQRINLPPRGPEDKQVNKTITCLPNFLIILDNISIGKD